MRTNNKSWITTGIKISCGSSTDLKLQNYYKLHCKILSNVITEAKRTWYNKQILTSNNKTKTTSNITKTETGKKDSVDIYWSSNDGDESHDYQVISDSFNNYFLLTAEKITTL